MTLRTKNTALCTLLVALTAALRLWYIGAADIGNDECFSLYYAQKPLADIPRALASYDNPPLWELLLHFWIMLFGIGTVALRMLPTVFSALTVIPIYLAGEKHIGRGAGVVASVMYACSTFSIFLAHDGRVYALVGMLAAWSVYLFLNITQNKACSKGHLWWLSVVNLLLLYCHYMAFWVPVAECIVVLCSDRLRRSMWRAVLLHAIILAVGYTPMWPTIVGRMLDSGVHGTWIARSTGFTNLYSMMCCFTNAPVPTVLLLALLLVATVVAIVKIIKHRYTPGVTVILATLWAIPLLVSFALSFIRGMFLNRYFYFTLPTYYLCIVACIGGITRRIRFANIATMVAVAVLMASTVRCNSSTLRYAGHKGDTHAVANRVYELTATGKAQLMIAPAWIDKQLVYYFDTDHHTFASCGTLQQPVFAQVMTQRGIMYCDALQTPTTDTFYILREPWYDISPWEEMLQHCGYTLTSTEQHTQHTITTYILM